MGPGGSRGLQTRCGSPRGGLGGFDSHTPPPNVYPRTRSLNRRWIMADTRIACVQMDVAIGNVEENRRRIIARLREAAASDARLVIFPECALTGYCFDSLAEAAPFAEPSDGPSARAIAEACREANTHAVFGFIERAGNS